MKLKQTGSVFVHCGLWYYSVKLPGESKRRQIPLRAPASDHTMSADRPRAMAEEAAARYWEEKTKQMRKGDAASVSVDDVCAAYCKYAETYYRHEDGSQTGEALQVAVGVRLLRKMYGRAAISELTHGDLMRWRDALERSGLARVTVNKRIGIVKRMMAFALDQGHISAAVKVELSQVANLKRGRCLAHETDPVRPVNDEEVEKALSAMMPNTADMVRLHRATGMRPEEVCCFKWSDVDTCATPWIYRPTTHKNKWRNQPRVVLIGPKGREVLERHKGVPIPFSPAQALLEYFEAKREAATSPSKVCRADQDCPRKVCDVWMPGNYTRTIRRACLRAGIAVWSPNRLRHSFATKVRRGFGLDACRAVLGHSVGGGCVTDRYSFEALEDEIIKAATPAVEALG